MATCHILADGATPSNKLDPLDAGVRLWQDESVMTVLVGKRAPDFELLDSEGKMHRLDQYLGRWLLMVFHRHLM